MRLRDNRPSFSAPHHGHHAVHALRHEVVKANNTLPHTCPKAGSEDGLVLIRPALQITHRNLASKNPQPPSRTLVDPEIQVEHTTLHFTFMSHFHHTGCGTD